ncbi:NACHT domain-containing NTPase [Streptomyces sp. NBC_00620]|uniref:NACHT domain-containing protein n=1 Tax=Streptomyces sp. NBC_00620 TaxID=2903666 RepID=UPI0022555785|nr:hypothetical protein [Streptomyces sp. NBC_00620]MCX4975086.1 hypothetical protein [Streptomyces sp. NBC_00620]
MRFDLYRLGPREFENLTQAIASAEIGPFVTMLGPGPDGGREATFNGTIKAPEGSRVWDGYGVLQAKYKETPAPPREEASWLIREIRKEFKEWKESEKRSPKPDYIIFASNVSLSATPGTGGIDRVTKEMETQCAKLGIKGWAVWHAENICRFLEKHDGIRTSYSAWILPGDILSSLYGNIQREKIETAQAIRSFLARELLKDRYANLDQAGAADDRTTPLADVFVDLPIGLAAERSQSFQARCLETLIAACDVNQANRWEDPDRETTPNKFVLVGGPGQGKSTVSQFMCQLYRAFLVRETVSMRNADVKTAVSRITEQAERESLVPGARRWPVKIPLTRFADELARGRCHSVLDYIAEQVSEGSAVSVSALQIRDWLRDFPWLLILDGLDEVPGTSNRAQVMNRINEFQIEADETGADLVIVATTRPQGYTDEFSPENFRHYVLLPLEGEHALAYGLKLAISRHGAESEKVSRLMSRLQQASAEASTAHLMGTPLQVTIMAVLLDRVGKAPKDRFTLFAEYYRVIYERELEKEGAASNLLRDHWTDINSIHADVGLLLQERSERSGETESRLTLLELNEIIFERLQEEGHEGEALLQLAASLSRLATDRLVFLVPSREGEVSFEIRSLQEFWAADALLKCGEEEIANRLQAMSLNSHWRNVLLFALGNIFVNRRTLRDSVMMLVSELNTHSDVFGNLPRRTFTGSRLAVEILHDGMVKAPRYEVTLVEEALKLFSLPPAEHVAMLGTCISERGMAIARDAIETKLRAGTIPSKATLQFIGIRADHRDPWAVEALQSLQSGSSQERLRVLEIGLECAIPSLFQSMAGCLASPETTNRLPYIALRSSHEAIQLREFTGSFSAPAWLAPLFAAFSGTNSRGRNDCEIALFRGPNGRLVTLRLSKVRSRSWEPLQEAQDSNFPENHWLMRVVDFCRNPNSISLADAVNAALPNAPSVKPLRQFLPWIFVEALSSVEKGRSTIAEISDGRLGELQDWDAVEDSWLDFSLNHLSNSFDDWLRDRVPFIPVRSSRFLLARSHIPGTLFERSLDSMLSIIGNRTDLSDRSRLASHVMTAVTDPYRGAHGEIGVSATPHQVMQLANYASHGSHTPLGWLGAVPCNAEWMEVLDRVGRYTKIGDFWMPYIEFDVVEYWSNHFELAGLGRLVIPQFARSGVDPATCNKVLAEWQRVRTQLDRDPEVAMTVGLAAMQIIPPKDHDDVQQRMTIIKKAAASGRANIAEVIQFISLKLDEVSIDFATEILNWVADDETIEDLPSIYDRVVRFQSSPPSGISFTGMRPT